MIVCRALRNQGGKPSFKSGLPEQKKKPQNQLTNVSSESTGHSTKGFWPKTRSILQKRLCWGNTSARLAWAATPRPPPRGGFACPAPGTLVSPSCSSSGRGRPAGGTRLGEARSRGGPSTRPRLRPPPGWQLHRDETRDAQGTALGADAVLRAYAACANLYCQISA